MRHVDVDTWLVDDMYESDLKYEINSDTEMDEMNNYSTGGFSVRKFVKNCRDGVLQLIAGTDTNPQEEVRRALAVYCSYGMKKDIQRNTAKVNKDFHQTISGLLKMTYVRSLTDGDEDLENAMAFLNSYEKFRSIND